MYSHVLYTYWQNNQPKSYLKSRLRSCLVKKATQECATANEVKRADCDQLGELDAKGGMDNDKLCATLVRFLPRLRYVIYAVNIAGDRDPNSCASRYANFCLPIVNCTTHAGDLYTVSYYQQSEFKPEMDKWPYCGEERLIVGVLKKFFLKRPPSFTTMQASMCPRACP